MVRQKRTKCQSFAKCVHLRAIVVTGVLLSLAGGCRSRTDKPNVVVILSDTLRASSMSLYGYPRKTDPNLSTLAVESIVFNDHRAHFPGTPISVSQMFSGRLMPPLLMTNNDFAIPVRQIGSDLLILPRFFQAAGYRTGVVTAHPWFKAEAPLLKDFDVREIVDAPQGAQRSYATIADLFPKVKKFLGETTEPFFLYVHTMDTHGPHQVRAEFPPPALPPSHPESYDGYDSAIILTDHWVNQIVEELRKSGELERTIFVFTSDHGEEFGELGPEPWNANHGLQVRPALLHVPLLIRLPGAKFGGTHYQSMSRHIDVAPTLLALALPTAELGKLKIDGESLVPFFDGKATPPEDQSSFGYSPRYWGLRRGGMEMQFDQWTNTVTSLARVIPDGLNYQRLEAVNDPVIEEQMKTSLLREAEVRTAEFQKLAPLERMPPVETFFPSTVVHEEGGSTLTFEQLPDDDRWSWHMSLQCSAQEHPAPLSLSMPWVPGRYRVQVRVVSASLKRGDLNQFALRFGDGPPQVLKALADQPLIDAGIHELSDPLRVTLSDPVGGVEVSSLRIEPIESVNTNEADRDKVREQLRQLGYVK